MPEHDPALHVLCCEELSGIFEDDKVGHEENAAVSQAAVGSVNDERTSSGHGSTVENSVEFYLSEISIRNKAPEATATSIAKTKTEFNQRHKSSATKACASSVVRTSTPARLVHKKDLQGQLVLDATSSVVQKGTEKVNCDDLDDRDVLTTSFIATR